MRNRLLCLYDCTVILINFALLATQYFIIDRWYDLKDRLQRQPVYPQHHPEEHSTP